MNAKHRRSALMMVLCSSLLCVLCASVVSSAPRARQGTLDGMKQAMGDFPADAEKVPLDVQVTEEVKTPKYVRKKLTFAAEKGDRVPAYLLVPLERQGKTAAVLCLHQTTRIGKGEPAGLGGK